MKRLNPEEKLARELFRATAKAVKKSVKWEGQFGGYQEQWLAVAKYVVKHFKRKVKR